MDFSDYTIDQNFIHYILKKLLVVKPLLHSCFSNESNLRTIFKRGTNKIQTQGDVTVALKPLMMRLSEIYDKEGKMVTEKCIQDCLEKEICLISRTDICKGTLKIFFSKKSLLCLSLPSVTDNFWSTKLLSKYKINLEIPINEQNQSLTFYRCNLVSLHLKKIFEFHGASVQIKFINHNNCGDSINKPLEEETSQNPSHILNYIISNKYGRAKQKYHILILCSPVIQKIQGSKSRLSHKDYIELLKKELKRASEHKYKTVETMAWNDYFNNLAEGCLALQLMAVNHLSVVKIDLNENSQNSRASAFILYNHARLCTLFRNLDTLIDEEVIPCVPPIENVDFALLRHPEEWDLFWLFVHRYPEVLQDVSKEIISISKENCRDSRPFNFRTRTLHNFLHDLAHCVSVYYNRVHILPSRDKRSASKLSPHLLPVFWARIYLLKGVHYVMRSCFESLNVVPPNVM